MLILIKNGTIINADNSIASDVLIKDNQILQVGIGIQTEIKINKIIDASGCFLFPGAIDPHVHLYGGTTTIIDFVTPLRGQSIYDALLERKEEASKSLIDFKFHVSPVEWVSNTEYEIYRCFKEEGVRSFKVYMAYKNNIGINDGAIFKVMKTVGKLGGVVAIHCEMGDEIEIIRNNFVSNGKCDVKYHAMSRPSEMEAIAVKRASNLAAKAECPLYIVHVSAKESLSHIHSAQESMQPVYAETCPQYLLFDDEKYNMNFEKSAPYVMSPPLRKKEDNEALWQAIADGTIQCVGTDHCPFFMIQKKSGLDDFRKIPNGAGGIEHRLELLYTYGVLQNKISINRFIEIVSLNPAKIFGLYPRKGIIAKGSDADIVIWDPKVERIISAKNHNQNGDINIFEGIEIKGQAKHVISNGRVIVENGEMVRQYKGLYLL
jgi:dihydropyrimidinase